MEQIASGDRLLGFGYCEWTKATRQTFRHNNKTILQLLKWKRSARKQENLNKHSQQGYDDMVRANNTPHLTLCVCTCKQ